MVEPRIAFLGPPDSPLLPFLDGVIAQVVEPITPEHVGRIAPDWVISYGYRHIVPASVLAQLPDRIVNLHIAFLPHNRGADPNLWSWIDGTPKGVTIHYMDEHLDTGDIIAQREVSFSRSDTLATSYVQLQWAMVALFVETWPAIVDGTAPRWQQPDGGSYHRSADRARFEHLLTRGWDTPVSALTRRG